MSGHYSLQHEVARLPGRGSFVYANKHCLGSPQQSTSVSDQLLKAQSLLLGFFCLQIGSVGNCTQDQ